MLLELLSTQGVVFLGYFLHLGLEFVDHLQILRGIAHLLSVLNEFLDMFFLILNYLLLRFNLGLQVLDLAILLLDDPLEIHDSFQRDLIGLLALVILDCLLQTLDHFVCILQLQVLGLEGHWVSTLVVFAL